MMGYKFLLSFLMVSSLAACQTQTRETTNNDTHQVKSGSSELYAKKTYTLPTELNEISGMTFLSNSDDITYVIQDEDGIVFTYDLKNGVIKSQFEFGPDADYEEITTDGEYFYVLQSNGTIFSFPVTMDIDQGKVSVFKGLLDKGEYESMSYDTKTKSLVVICKTCKLDKGEPKLTGYVLGIAEMGEISLKNPFSIDLSGIAQKDSKNIESLKPSAISKRNSDNQWYLLSSIDNLLLILDENFVPKEVHRFKKKQFEQPEGISFNNQDKLFISSEKGKSRNAFIYQINLN